MTLALGQATGGANLGQPTFATLTILDDDVAAPIPEPVSTNAPPADDGDSMFVPFTAGQLLGDGGVVLTWASETNSFSQYYFT